MSNVKGHIYGLIDEIKASESITKAKLSILSRDILSYVIDTQDINAVNRLLGVLTPMNKKAATAYFQAFLPWENETDGDGAFTRFGKKSKGDKRVSRMEKAIVEWLAIETNNLWVWADTHVTVEVKKKDFKALVEKAITNALKGDEKSDTPALDRADLLKAIFAGGVTIDDMLQGCADMEEQSKAEAPDSRMDDVDLPIPQAA